MASGWMDLLAFGKNGRILVFCRVRGLWGWKGEAFPSGLQLFLSYSIQTQTYITTVQTDFLPDFWWM
jgi:hypothetical protein